EGGADAALRRHGVAASGEHLGDAGRAQALLGHAEGGAQSGAAGTDDDHVVGMVDDRIGVAVDRRCLDAAVRRGHARYRPKRITRRARWAARPRAMLTNFTARMAAIFAASL